MSRGQGNSNRESNRPWAQKPQIKLRPNDKVQKQWQRRLLGELGRQSLGCSRCSGKEHVGVCVCEGPNFGTRTFSDRSWDPMASKKGPEVRQPESILDLQLQSRPKRQNIAGWNHAENSVITVASTVLWSCLVLAWSTTTRWNMTWNQHAGFCSLFLSSQLRLNRGHWPNWLHMVLANQSPNEKFI